MKLKFYQLFFGVALIIHIVFSLLGWNGPITDLHGFRQTQTAISSYFFVKEGFQINYQTPILGPPWSIPLEFPLFQATVALIVKIFHTPLDQTGRFTSLIFFYLIIAAVFAILKELKLSSPDRFLTASLILVSPIYIFWSRTFMIESLALFLSLLYLYFTLIQYRKQSKLKLLLAQAFTGSLAILTKITTFIPIVIPVGIYHLFLLKSRLQKKNSGLFNIISTWVSEGIISIFLPLFVGVIWVRYSDSIRSLNPLGSDVFVTDKIMWIFGGTFEKLHPEFWISIFGKINSFVLGSWYLILLILAINLFANKYRVLSLISLGVFFLGPVIFTNLYSLHDYYYYANSVFIYSSLGFSLASLLEIKKIKPLLYLTVIPGLFALLIYTYLKSYYPAQKSNTDDIREIGKIINRSTSDDDILLIYGYNLDPRIPYYSKRKAIMDQWNRPLSNEQIHKSILKLGQEKIGGLLVLQNWPDFINDRVKDLNLSPQPVFVNKWGSFYVRNKI